MKKYFILLIFVAYSFSGPALSKIVDPEDINSVRRVRDEDAKKLGIGVWKLVVSSMVLGDLPPIL